MKISKPTLFLLFIMVLVAICTYFYNEGISISDDYVYAKTSYQIANGTYELTPRTFENRFGLLLPTALVIKLFGVNGTTMKLWPLTSLFLLFLSVYVILGKSQPRLALLSIAIIGLNPLVLDRTADLSPDIPVMAFSTISILILYQVLRNQVEHILLFAALFILTGFWAFITKTSFIYVAPFIGGIMLYELVKRRNLKFWGYSMFIAFIVALFYFGWYYINTGDALYRLSGVESKFNQGNWSMAKASLDDLVLRLTWQVPIFLLRSLTFCGVLIFAIPLLTRLTKHPFNTLIPYFGLYFLYLLAIHWLGTTSLQMYSPLPLLDRMWTLLIPPASILAAQMLLYFGNKEQHLVNNYHWYCANIWYLHLLAHDQDQPRCHSILFRADANSLFTQRKKSYRQVDGDSIPDPFPSSAV